MQKEDLINRLAEAPIIAAIKSESDLEKALKSECEAVFVLYGKVTDIDSIVNRIKQVGKMAFVHLDLIDGLAQRESAIDFLIENTKLDGMISTKSQLVRYAKSKGLITIQRFFMLDSLALANIKKQMEPDNADLIEILPGIMPKVIKQLVATSKCPIIAGGLISDKDDVVNALGAGAIAVSSSSADVWFFININLQIALYLKGKNYV